MLLLTCWLVFVAIITPYLLAGFISISCHCNPGISELSCAHRDATALWALC